MSIPIAVADTAFIIATVAKSVTMVVAISTVDVIVIIGANGEHRSQDAGCCIRWCRARAAEPPRSAAPQAPCDAKADAGVGAVVRVRAK